MVSQSTLRYDPDVALLASEAVDLMWNEYPGYSAGIIQKTDLISSVEQYVQLAMRVIRSGKIPGYEELASGRDLGSKRAAQHVPLESVILAFRATERVILLDLFSEAHQWPRQLTRHYADLVISTFDLLSQETVNSYHEASSAMEALQQRVQNDLIRALVSGISPHPAQLENWAQMLGIESGRPYLAMAILTGENEDPLQTVRTRRRFSLSLQPLITGPILYGVSGAAQIGLFSPTAPVARVLETLGAAVAELHRSSRMVVGTGSASTSLSTAGLSCTQALSAADVGLRQGGAGTVVRYEKVLVDALLLEQADVAARLVNSRLHALQDQPYLLETLQALIENDFSQSKTARSMYVHLNTVGHRLKKIRTLTGYDPLRLSDLLELGLALRYLKLEQRQKDTDPD